MLRVNTLGRSMHFDSYCLSIGRRALRKTRVKKTVTGLLPQRPCVSRLPPRLARFHFLQHFVHQDERYRTSYPWVQKLRAWWLGLTLPPRFLLARATPSGWEHTAYDFVSSREEPMDSRQAHRGRSRPST